MIEFLMEFEERARCKGGPLLRRRGSEAPNKPKKTEELKPDSLSRLT